MSTYDDSVYRNSPDETDDLEQTLVQVAAAADARNIEQQENEAESETSTNTESNPETVRPKFKRKHEENERNEWDGGKYVSHLNESNKARYYSDRVENLEDGNDDVEERYKLKRRSGNDGEEYASKVKRLNEHDSIEGHAKVVATHYNALEEKGLDERSKSRIFYMRNFHNWIKSMLINEYLTKIKNGKKYNEPIRVHDMCCGKGGDLLKWRKGNITHLICSDIASVSLDQCKTRYHDMKHRSYRERHSGNIYAIEYIHADCSKVRLREKYLDPSIQLDIVSCQFAFHYSFESLPQAECMMKNAAECLRPGGFFIGTIPDANELMTRVHKSDTNGFGNSVLDVTFDCNTDSTPLFGAKYNFSLDGVVDCPEFLVHFPLLEKLAKKFGLKLVKKEKFYDFFLRMKEEGRNLMTNVKCLETYPPPQGVELVGNADDDYEHAKLHLKLHGKNLRIGTLSRSEWEASCK